MKSISNGGIGKWEGEKPESLHWSSNGRMHVFTVAPWTFGKTPAVFHLIHSSRRA